MFLGGAQFSILSATSQHTLYIILHLYQLSNSNNVISLVTSVTISCNNQHSSIVRVFERNVMQGINIAIALLSLNRVTRTACLTIGIEHALLPLRISPTVLIFTITDRHHEMCLVLSGEFRVVGALS